MAGQRQKFLALTFLFFVFLASILIKLRLGVWFMFTCEVKDGALIMTAQEINEANTDSKTAAFILIFKQ